MNSKSSACEKFFNKIAFFLIMHKGQVIVQSNKKPKQKIYSCEYIFKIASLLETENKY